MSDLADADLFGLVIPEEYGGLGFGAFENCLVVEELSRICCGITTAYAASGLGAYPILLFGNDEQKKKYLPIIASGEQLAAFGLTESTAGSDAAGIQTTAVKDGDHYVLNGTKQWITNAAEAGIYTVIAMTDRKKGARGATAFIVEKDDRGSASARKRPRWDQGLLHRRADLPGLPHSGGPGPVPRGHGLYRGHENL